MACPNWQAYIVRMYGGLAEPGFRVVWVEDDLRYHNHAPLDWGGDFSQPMVARFARKVGRDVSRDEVVKSILRPGPPHEWRSVWLETWRETQLEVAQRIRDAVRDTAPDTCIGVMTSHPSNHSIEGRDWSCFFSAFAGERGLVAHRPHFAGYQDGTRADFARSSFLLDVQKGIRPSSLRFEVAPEIENFPMSPFSKSNAVTWGQMALAQIHGADAQLLDLFSFTGLRIKDEPWVGGLLDMIRPGLDALAEMFPPHLQTRGVGVLWREDAALHARTSRGESMSELYVPLTPAAEILQSLGIAVQAREGDVNCLWGQVCWAYDDDELTRILSGRVWLDAESVCILQQRGFGALLPVEHGHWWSRGDMNYSMEHPEQDVTGLHRDIWLSVNQMARVAYQTPKDGAVEWTSLRDARGSRIGCGMALWDNRLGGRVAACAWPLATDPYGYTLSPHRQVLVQQLISTLASGVVHTPTLVTGAAYAFPIDLCDANTRRVVIFNGSLDPQRPVVHISLATTVRAASMLSANAIPTSIAAEAQPSGHGLTIALGDDTPFCGIVVLTIE